MRERESLNVTLIIYLRYLIGEFEVRNFIYFMRVALKEHFWNVCREFEIFGDLCEWSQGCC
jgi:hypothetical protein